MKRFRPRRVFGFNDYRRISLTITACGNRPWRAIDWHENPARTASEHGVLRIRCAAWRASQRARSQIIAVFVKNSPIQASAREVFAWHQSPGALKDLIPPWEKVTVEQAPASLADGAVAVLVLRVGPFKLRWVARHRDFIDRGDHGGEFTDEQVSGPFASWVHRHIVRATGPNSCVLEDRIEYAVPLGRLGETLAGWHVRKKLRRMFDYRHAATISAVQSAGSLDGR